ncbi:hypothetical protein [Urbifossiella limnaea]|uniref:Uncharacterized protein n=1 Tax=Urbifossiella limnaea TaxID=2528023 RepID=A0A517XLV3_9BACT|nr:hypothetical protein [Urbifossiella limnaea]QDU18479.1 hypothetical protein ETAA1_03670 [Urbifossiella limnaea]
MPDDPPRLLGTYSTPAFKYGDAVMCEVRGEVLITGLTCARIPWPVGKRPASQGRALVVYAGLAAAVRRESSAAVCFYWGVTAQTVSKWRKALGVGQMTQGTALLKSEALRESEAMAAARERGWAKARDPERVRKIREAKLGKPRPDHVIDAMRQARLGATASDETRRKLSEAKKGKPRAPRKEWAEWELALLGELPDAEVAKRTGRSYASVASMRRKVGREPSDR